MGQGSARYNSITSLEKKLVNDSWMEMRPQIRDFGISLFLMMINDYPHFANYFPFSSVSDNSFERFTSQFMREFDRLVMHLNRPNKMHQLLRNNAIYHVKKNIPNTDYDRLRKCLISIIGDHIGVQSNRQETISAWIKVISICFSFITEMMEDMAADEVKITA